MSSQPPRYRASVPTGRRRHRLKLASTAGRIRILLLIMAILFSLTAARALQLQVIDASGKAAEAASNMTTTRDIAPLRGTITDRDGRVLAFTEATVDIVAYPATIAANGLTPDAATDKDKATGAKIPAIIAPVLAKDIPADTLQVPDINAAISDPTKKYVRLAKQVSIGTYNQLITDLKAQTQLSKAGLAWTVSKESDPKRIYPMNSVSSNVLGYMADGKGVAGLEKSYQTQMAGTPGREIYETSKNGPIPLGNSTVTPAVDGSSVQTTIDSSMCWNAQQLMDAQRQKIQAEWGFTVIMEIKTGKILCLSNAPTFDGNNPGAPGSALNDPALEAPFEPGSTMKLLSLAAVMDASSSTAHPITPDTLTHVDSKKDGIKSGNNTIHDSDDHPAIDYTTRGILVNSSNQGVIQLSREVFSDRGAEGKQQYIDYARSFGLGQKTNVGVPLETSGVFPADKILSDSYTMDSVSFGTSLSVNAVQMASAVSSVVNDGTYVQPTLVASVTGPDGTVTPTPAPATHQVIKASTSQELRSMMENRVLDSYKTIGIPGYRTGAKTGTARMGKSDLIMSIAGVAPINDPQLLVYTVFFQKDSQSGAGISAAGPTYQAIMSLALQRYGIQPNPDADQHCIEGKLSADDPATTNKCTGKTGQ